MCLWYAKWRVDSSEVFETDDGTFELLTTDFEVAVSIILQQLGGHYSLLEVRRIDV